MANHDYTNITREELTDYSIQAFDNKGKYDVKIPCPQINSQKHTGEYRLYDTQAFNSNMFQAIADGGLAPLATWGHSTDSYLIEVFGLRDFISDRDVVNQEEAIQLASDTSLFLARNSIKQRNKAFLDVALDTANASAWATELTGTTGAVADVINGSNQFQQFNEAGAEPLAVLDKVLETMLEATGLRGDTIILPRKVMTFLKRNDEINQYGINNPTGGIAGGDEYVINIIAQYTGIEASRIHVVEAVVDKAAITSTDSVEADHNNEDFGPKLTQAAENLGFMAEKRMLVCHMGDMGVGLRSQGAMVEFLWTGLYSGNGERGNFKIKTDYNANREGMYLEARQAFLFKVTAPKLGVLLKDVIA